MSEPFTFDDVDPDAKNDFDDLPVGTYTCLIEECVSGTSKNGTPELRVQFRVQIGEHKNRVISDWLYFNQNTQQLIATKITATGVKPPTGIKTADQAPARVSGLIHNRIVQIVVRPDEYPKGSGEFTNKVKAWKPATNAPQPAGVGAANGSSSAPDDTDIPFAYRDDFDWTASV